MGCFDQKVARVPNGMDDKGYRGHWPIPGLTFTNIKVTVERQKGEMER